MKPTHVLETQFGARIADIKLTRNTCRVHLYHPHKATEVSHSTSLCDAIAMGHWETEMVYIFGAKIVDAWPPSTHLRRLDATES